MKGIIFFVGLASVSGLAQGQRKIFYSSTGENSDSVASHHYIIETGNEFYGQPVIAFYTKTNTVFYNSGLPDNNNVRPTTYYYPDGAEKMSGGFYRDKPVGLVKSFYNNGSPQAELVFDKTDLLSEDDPVIGIINYWDARGNKLVEDGTGNCECDLSAYSGQAVVERGKVVDGLKVGQWEGEGDNFNFTEIYDEGHLVSGTMNYAGQKFEYKKSEKSAAPADGMKSFYQNLQKNITYPLKARRKGMQGTVFVQFLVGPGGELTNFRVVKGIGKECDDEAIRAMATSRPWQPGLLRGRPVQQLYILPVIFKLG